MKFLHGVLGVVKIANLIEFELRTWEEEASATFPRYIMSMILFLQWLCFYHKWMYIVNNGEAFQTNDSSISRLKVSAINFYGECCGFTLYGADV